MKSLTRLRIQKNGDINMPVRIKKVKGGYRVTHGGKVSAKRTTKKKAEKQKRLLNAVAHGWKPTNKRKK